MAERPDPLTAAITDLAEATGAPAVDIDVVAYEQVTWRDGSLGCGSPGLMYPQVLIDGYRIVLRVRGSEVTYHGASGRPPFRCRRPNPHGFLGDRPQR